MLTTRDDLTSALATLARTHRIELEAQSGKDVRFNIPDLQQGMEEYNQLARRYQAYWPNVEPDTDVQPGSPAKLVDRAVEKLRAWSKDAAGLVEKIESIEAETSDLELLGEMLAVQRDNVIDYSLLPGSGPVVSARIYVLPLRTALKTFPASLLLQRVPTAHHLFFIAVGTQQDLDTFGTDLSVVKGRELATPAWLKGDRVLALELVRQRLAELEKKGHTLRGELDKLAEKHGLAGALGDIYRMDWLITHVSSLPVTENFAWITGWTNDMDGSELERVLEQENIHFILHFPAPPEDSDAPMLFSNPWWAQPFELFSRLLGTPASTEADPSRILALMVPLLFGYMFGDVGQGLVIMLAGFYLQRRWPLARLLIANGLSATLFGFVFGSVFGSEQVIPALWVHPIEQPLPVLLVPLVGGIVILLIGLLINMAESIWQGQFRQWLAVEAAVLLLYVSLIASYFTSAAFSVSILALAWYIAGAAMQARGQSIVSRVTSAAGVLLENIFQLTINTISFVRVGAFALAHAGLSMAFYSLASATTSIIISFTILIIGNIVIILLEGLVVTIQTTRLVLFEFFIRFLRGTGRMFRPLVAPTGPSKLGDHRE
jgi:V/A-type H+-transporting ATPase subunit I